MNMIYRNRTLSQEKKSNFFKKNNYRAYSKNNDDISNFLEHENFLKTRAYSILENIFSKLTTILAEEVLAREGGITLKHEITTLILEFINELNSSSGQLGKERTIRKYRNLLFTGYASKRKRRSLRKYLRSLFNTCRGYLARLCVDPDTAKIKFVNYSERAEREHRAKWREAVALGLDPKCYRSWAKMLDCLRVRKLQKTLDQKINEMKLNSMLAKRRNSGASHLCNVMENFLNIMASDVDNSDFCSFKE